MPMENNPAAAALAVRGLSTAVLGSTDGGHGGPPTIKLTERQARLTRRWGFFTAKLYERHAIDWNGNPVLDDIARMDAAARGFVPFSASPGQESLPLALRRPTVAYPLGRLIISRFTGLLFSAKRHPSVTVVGDEDDNAWLKAALDSGRFWARMRRARDYGGGQGTAVVGFAFIDGKVRFEVLDPRWCEPHFSDYASRELAALEIRHLYTVPLRDSAGVSREAWFWYRRRIDAETDTVWARVPAGDGKEEPEWGRWRCSKTTHGFGFVPFQWVQNAPVDDAVDGEPDCAGCYDGIEAIDRLLSQANRGVLAACDPTLTISTDDDIQSAERGSDNLLRIGQGDNASYLELGGSGPEAATKLADRIESLVLRTAQCVIEQGRSGGERTATEITSDVSAMYERGDVFREQYAEECIRPLLDKLLRAARTVASREAPGTESGDEAPARGAFALPPRRVRDEKTGKVTLAPQKLGSGGGSIDIAWPDYERPTLNDRDVAQRAATGAYGANLLSQADAVRFLAPYFDVEDHQAALLAIQKASAEQAAQESGQAYEDVGGGETRAEAPGAPAGEADEADEADGDTRLNPAEVFAYDGDMGEGVPTPDYELEGEEAAGEEAAVDTSAEDAVVEPPVGNPTETAMNGAQVTAMIGVVQAIREGTLGKRAAIRILMRGFGMEQAEAEDMLADEKEGSNPPAPKTPPGGGSFGASGSPKGPGGPPTKPPAGGADQPFNTKQEQ